ncbi:hypothetical protein GCM10023084_37280 [Streptomyces lacrimifluminis]|uniref:Membrane transport protein MMPL domain-containing protein n=1 Tax=Streptomyces lacrimifluminis TaxID=1500077 RepID=A0A917L0H6_9ACTN|nr:hypothetical protein GCM10012282_36670 [Streptomyces lacrimifluminis]
MSYEVAQTDVSGAAHTVQSEVVAQGEKAGVKVSLGGNAVKNEATSKVAELIGVGVAAIVLMITFGSLIAAGLPLLTAILGVAAAILSVRRVGEEACGALISGMGSSRQSRRCRPGRGRHRSR